jgi:hypothetical protein
MKFENYIMEIFEWIIVNGQKETALRYNTVVFHAGALIHQGYEMPNKTNKQNLISRYYELDRVIDLESLQDIYFCLDELKIYRNKISASHLIR